MSTSNWLPRRVPMIILGLACLGAPVQASEPPHPIFPITGSGSGADAILATYTEAQFLRFVPEWGPRNADYGFVSAVVAGDNDWSWDPAFPDQLTSLPSGTVFPNATYAIRYEPVAVLSGKTMSVPYYLAAGSTTRKSLVFGEISYQKRRKLRSFLGTLAAAYVGSGGPGARNEAYARRIAIALDAWAGFVPDYYMTGKNSATFISATGFTKLTSDIQRASDHNGLAHEWDESELFAFDAIYDSLALVQLSAERGYDVRQHIKDGLFFNIGDFISNRVPVSVAIATNLSGPFTVLAKTARVLNRPDHILWMGDYLDATVRQKIMRDGVLGEGIGYSYGYLTENLDGARATRDYFLTRAADTPALQGVSVASTGYVKTIEDGIAAWNAARLPDGTLASFGDTNFNKSAARNTGQTTLLPAYGHLALGTGSGSKAVQLNQNLSDDANHMRADVTGFGLWANGAELLGNIRYYNPTPGRQFTEQILAYDAVTVDRTNMSRGGWTVGAKNHKFTSGNLTLFAPVLNGLGLTEVDGQRAYANKTSRYQRFMVLNTVDPDRPYVLDVFRVAGGRTHDYTLHGAIRFDQAGESSVELTPMSGDYPLLEGSETWVEPTSSGSKFPYYGFFRSVSTGTAPDDFQVTYREPADSHRDLRLWMTGETGATLYLGITPNPERNNSNPPNFYKYWRPATIVRHRVGSGTLQSLYAGVVEPLAGGASTIQSVTRLPLAATDLEAVALRVTFVDGRVDTYLINLRNPKVAGAAGGQGTISTADGAFALTGRFGAYVQRPGDPRVWTTGADSFTFSGRSVATGPSLYSGSVTGMTRKAGGAAFDAFIVDAPLPLGAVLQGRQLSLSFGDYQVVGSTTVQKGISEMFEIDHVEQTDGQTHVVLTRDHQLEMSGATIVEQMAPQRTFTGQHSFEIVTSAAPDIVPPVLSLPADITAEATGPNGAAITFEAGATDDRDGTVPVTYSIAPGSTFPLGTTTVEATARDVAGNTARGRFTVTVQDTTPPAIEALTASPSVLWPPNHRMSAVQLLAQVRDAADPAPRTRIVEVSSNEPADGTGDGDTSPDWAVTGDLALDVRAERAGGGSGRIYTITVESRDAAGNASRGTVEVSVPHNP